MVRKAAVGVILVFAWLALVGSGTFVLTLCFLVAGIIWGRKLGRRDIAKVVNEAHRWHALQTELRHIERDADHEAQHLSGWYRRERERIVGGW